jgi:uncharacterized protein with GYD domain
MAKYLIKASYTGEGLQGLMKAGGSSRVSAVEKALAGVGGTIESFYFAFGADDAYVIVDGPDNVGAMAMAATIGGSPAIGSYETVVLLTPAEVDQAMSVSVDYAPPGTKA